MTLGKGCPLSVDAAAPSAVELAGAITDQLREYLRSRRNDAAYIGTDYAELTAALEEFVLRGGKRLRPLLVLVAAGEAVEAEPGVVRAATAVELVHAATLVHDDVLDAAPLRRGRPTVWATAGREAATATGDHLFARAFSELAANDRIEEVQALSAASSALAEGELLQRADAWDTSIGEERYLRRCERQAA